MVVLCARLHVRLFPWVPRPCLSIHHSSVSYCLSSEFCAPCACYHSRVHHVGRFIGFYPHPRCNRPRGCRIGTLERLSCPGCPCRLILSLSTCFHLSSLRPSWPFLPALALVSRVQASCPQPIMCLCRPTAAPLLVLSPPLLISTSPPSPFPPCHPYSLPSNSIPSWHAFLPCVPRALHAISSFFCCPPNLTPIKLTPFLTSEPTLFLNPTSSFQLMTYHPTGLLFCLPLDLLT